MQINTEVQEGTQQQHYDNSRDAQGQNIKLPQWYIDEYNESNFEGSIEDFVEQFPLGYAHQFRKSYKELKDAVDESRFYYVSRVW